MGILLDTLKLVFIVLAGLTMAYGLWRVSRRTPREKQRTEAKTREIYKENRDDGTPRPATHGAKDVRS